MEDGVRKRLEDNAGRLYEFDTMNYGVSCEIRVILRARPGEKGRHWLQARRKPTEQNLNTEWHDIDIGEMLARTDLELVR